MFGRTGAKGDARSIILAAAGPAFCAGHDLREMTGLDAKGYAEVFELCTAMMTKIQSVPQPVIAEVQGMATAAGCQLVATCDLAIASEAATFATPGVRIGLFCSTPMVAVSRALGRKRALEMLLTGEAIDARTAADWGLVNRVVPQTELRAATLALAERIGQASAFTLKTGSKRSTASRTAASRGLRIHATSDDRKRPGRRRPGRHLRVSRKARAALAGP